MDGAVAATSAQARTRQRPVDDWMAAPVTTSQPVTTSRPMSASRNELAVKPAGGSPARRTITITGLDDERSRNTRSYDLDRRRTRERNAHHKPDRIAMWAVLLGIAMALAAATSSHAAVLTAHVALMLPR